MVEEILDQIAVLRYAKECLATEDSIAVHVGGTLHTYTKQADIQVLIEAQHRLLEQKLQKPTLITDG